MELIEQLLSFGMDDIAVSIIDDLIDNEAK